MSYSRATLLLMCLLVPIGCASGKLKSASATFDEFEMRRGPCPGDGSCPTYRVTLRRTGEIIFDGQKNVKALGPQTAAIAPRELTILDEALTRIDFFHLRETYDANSDGCKRISTDMPSVTFEARTGATTKLVSYSMGCWGLPLGPRLRWLADTVDELARTQQWVPFW